MQSDSFSVYFFLRKGLSDKKKWKIYCRVLVDRIKSDFATSCAIEHSKWDKASGKVKGNNVVNDELVDVESKIRSTRTRLIDNGISFDALHFTSQLHKIVSQFWDTLNSSFK